MKYTDIIFDFDGTLSDTYPCFTNALLEVCNEYGLNPGYQKVYDLLKVSVGTAIKSLPFNEDYSVISDKFHDYHNIFAVTEQKPFPESEELLRFIKNNGGRNYIYSHSGIIVCQLVNLWGWGELFDGIIDARTKLPRKPDPTGLNYLCSKFGIDKSNAIMIGDRSIDTDAGKNAGMDGCLFDPENYYPTVDVTYRVNNLLEIKDIVK